MVSTHGNLLQNKLLAVILVKRHKLPGVSIR